VSITTVNKWEEIDSWYDGGIETERESIGGCLEFDKDCGLAHDREGKIGENFENFSKLRDFLPGLGLTVDAEIPQFCQTFGEGRINEIISKLLRRHRK
jgi:hypothetical protein